MQPYFISNWNGHATIHVHVCNPIHAYIAAKSCMAMAMVDRHSIFVYVLGYTIVEILGITKEELPRETSSWSFIYAMTNYI